MEKKLWHPVLYILFMNEWNGKNGRKKNGKSINDINSMTVAYHYYSFQHCCLSI